ncbi:MAG: hypothetical protein OEM60_08725 [Gammaproteobacteria bacterium]|nr:hypothetical protein [Gammaproteobacteria bacterium]
MKNLIKACLTIFTRIRSRNVCLAIAACLLLPIAANAGQVAYDYVGEGYENSPNSPWSINGSFVLDEADVVPGTNLVSKIVSWEFSWTNGTDTYSTSSEVSNLAPDGVGEFYFIVDDQLAVDGVALENDAGPTRHPLFGFEFDGLVWNASTGEYSCCVQGQGSFSGPRTIEDTVARPRHFKTLDLSSIVNSDLADTPLGDFFPRTGAISLGDIPFHLTNGGNGNAWAVEGLQVSPDGIISNPYAIFSISGLSIRGATKMYAVINSAFGICDVPVGSIGVTGVEFELIEGKNIRNWLEGPFCNTQTDAVYTADFDFLGSGDIPPGRARFDVYEFDLSGLPGPINEFTFENYGEFFILGAPFLIAVTFEIEATPGVVHSVHVGGPDACAAFGRPPGCDANFSLTANEFENGQVNGRWTDRFGNGTGFTAAIDCLAVEGNQAWVSGHVVTSNSDRYVIGQPVITTMIDNAASPDPDFISRSYRRDQSCHEKPDVALLEFPQGQVTVR